MTPTPAALAMRRYRARKRETNSLRVAVHIFMVFRAGRNPAWEGRVQRGGVRHVICRSVSKHGQRAALDMVESQVERWLAGEK
jgi:hypothetical protein